MNGFVNTVNGYSLSAIQELKTLADEMYITGTPPPSGDDPDYITGASGTVYYVDAVDGDDGNLGTSEGAGNAWQSMSKVNSSTFSAGDVIAFKRGQSFAGTISITDNGTSLNNIYLTSYGTGARPILGAKTDFSGSWTSIGSNKFTRSGGSSHRMWRDGVEIGKVGQISSADDLGELGAFTDAGVFGYVGGTTTYYTTDTLAAVNASTFTRLGNFSVLTISGDYITISGLDLRHGASHCINLLSAYTTVHFNSIGWDAGYGIVADGATFSIIERNTFDNNFSVNFDGVAQYRIDLAGGGTVDYQGTDARGSNDAIVSWSDWTDSEIRYNDFLRWGHAAVAFTSTGNARVTRNKIHHNTVKNPEDLLYVRAFGYSGTGVSNNEFHNNYVENMYIRSQMNGNNNHIHHNWIINGHNTPYKTGEQGQGFGLETYNGNCESNTYEYNTFDTGTGPAIDIIARGIASPVIQNNIIHKNLFDNCGTDPYFARGLGDGTYIQDYQDILGNTYTNNYYYSPLTVDTISHRNVECTPTEFNARNGTGGDEISGNTTTLTDQGAGVYDPNSVGVGGV